MIIYVSNFFLEQKAAGISSLESARFWNVSIIQGDDLFVPEMIVLVSRRGQLQPLIEPVIHGRIYFGFDNYLVLGLYVGTWLMSPFSLSLCDSFYSQSRRGCSPLIFLRAMLNRHLELNLFI